MIVRTDTRKSKLSPFSTFPSKRPPPAFMVYAASRLADRDFKAMSACERGVLHTAECECWVNGTVPSDKRALARVLGLDHAEVETGLTEHVLRHFEQQGDLLICPELEIYRAELETRHAKMSAGGKQSAEAINRGRKRADSHPDSHPDEQADRALVQSSTGKSRAVAIHEVIPLGQNEFIKDMAGPAPFEKPAAGSYARIRG